MLKTVANFCSALTVTRGEELATFLDEEIPIIEKELRSEDLPVIKEFETQLNGPEITFTKKFNDEVITVKVNVNGWVVDQEGSSEELSDGEEQEGSSEELSDGEEQEGSSEELSDGEEQEGLSEEPSDAKEQEGSSEELSDAEEQESEGVVSMPDITIEIEKHGEVLSFNCSYVNAELEESTSRAHAGSFQISEVTFYSADFEGTPFTASAELMNRDQYDLLLNYLKERGISNDFIYEMFDFSVAYGHKMYIALLKDIKKFVEK